MSVWLSLAKSAPGLMVELLERKTSPRCLINGGHVPVWRTDVVACAYCKHTFPEATQAFYDEVASPEGMILVLGEAEKRRGL